MCFFYLIEQHSKFLLHALQVLYMCTLCDSTNINTIIDFVPHVSGDGFSGGSDSYLQFRDTHTHTHTHTHTPCFLKLCIPSSSGIVRWCVFPEFGAELPLDIVSLQSFWISLYLHLLVLDIYFKNKPWLHYAQRWGGKSTEQLKNFKVIFTIFDTQKKPTNTHKYIRLSYSIL